MNRVLKSFAGALAVSIAAAGQAHAAYFVNAFAQLGSGSEGGVVSNGPTSASAVVDNGGTAQGYVDMSAGTGKTYLGFYGPDVTGSDFGVAAAVFGDTVTFSGASTATFSFDIDGTATTSGIDGPNNVFIQLYGTLRVFAAGSGATSSNFAAAPGALVSQTFLVNYSGLTEDLDETIFSPLSGSTAVLGGGSYDVFASFSTGAALNGADVSVDLDFLNTTTFGIQTTGGVTYSSASGALVGSVPGAAVPEPGTWALMILGFGAAGVAIRRRRAGFASA